MKKYLILSLIILLFNLFSQSQNIVDVGNTRLYCSLEYIKIEGETNVNNFNFVFDQSYNGNIIITDINKKNRGNDEYFEFNIPVKLFRGNNNLMENDFYSLLDASNYPLITVDINEKEFNHIISHSDVSNMDFYITIAGVKKYVKGDYEVLFKDDHILLSGKTKLLLTDFSIIPPQKMFGILQVKDLIFIKFDIKINSKNV